MRIFIKLLPRKLAAIGVMKFLGSTWLAIKRAISLRLAGSFAQYGEDLQLENFIGQKDDGFYVDVGAYDPHRLSNTKRFYNKGWNGVNIEPLPRNFAQFVAQRPRDINLNVGVSDKPGARCLFEFDLATRSTFSAAIASKTEEHGLKIVGKHEVPVMTLKLIFAEYCPRPVDFLSIDTEGHELDVLRGNDWQKYRPSFICIESYIDDFTKTAGETEENRGIYEYLSAQKYERVWDNGTNCIYRDATS